MPEGGVRSLESFGDHRFENQNNSIAIQIKGDGWFYEAVMRSKDAYGMANSVDTLIWNCTTCSDLPVTV